MDKPLPALADLLSSYAGLLTLATTSVYCGAWGSLPQPSRNKPSAPYDSDDEEEEPDRISSGDALWFPVLGSAVLLGFYLTFKYLGPEWINFLIGWYFALAGVLSVWKSSVSLVRLVVPAATWKSFARYKVLLLKDSLEMVNVSLRTPSVVLLLPSIIPSALYVFLSADKKPALLSNILALSFSHSALSLLKLDSFRTGCILLAGLFAYDIFWVFGTGVMVKVATTLDAPIKLLWPKSVTFSATSGFSLLGLGDIVIPGAFVSLALRRDLARSPSKSYKVPFAKPYFTAALSAYVLGLVTTMVVMHTFKAAQPALLYLSPACILSFFITASLRGELKEAWSWEDGQPAVVQAVGEEKTDTSPFLAPPITDARELSDAEAADEQEIEGKPKKRKTKKSKA